MHEAPDVAQEFINSTLRGGIGRVMMGLALPQEWGRHDQNRVLFDRIQNLMTDTSPVTLFYNASEDPLHVVPVPLHDVRQLVAPIESDDGVKGELILANTFGDGRYVVTDDLYSLYIRGLFRFEESPDIREPAPYHVPPGTDALYEFAPGRVLFQINAAGTVRGPKYGLPNFERLIGRFGGE